MRNIYKTEDEIIIHDPKIEQIPLLKLIDPDYRIRSINPGCGFIPKFQALRRKKVTLDQPVFDLSIPELTGIINKSISGNFQIDNTQNGLKEYSVLDLCRVAAHKILSNCDLCGRQCSINRYKETGACGLTAEPFNANPFIHIAEEVPINPALVMSYSGCGMGCCYCIERTLYKSPDYRNTFHKAFWARYEKLKQEYDFNSIEFSNPTESVHSVLDILSFAPMDVSHPVVANVHLYSGKPFYDIALRFVDVWLTDFRYGNDECAKRLSDVDDYMKFAKLGMDQLTGSDSRIIVRILVLPGHLDCCLKPIVDILSEYRDRVWVSILDQYIPEHNAHRFQEINRRPNVEEVSALEEYSRKRGMKLVDSDAIEAFWQ